jgi:hypothetical protein
LKEQDFSGKIRTLKSKWHKTRENENLSVDEQKQNDTIYQAVEDEKLKCSEIYNNIARCKKKLSTTRSEVYVRQKALSSQSRITQASSSSPSATIDTSNSGFYKVEDVQLSANDLKKSIPKVHLFRNRQWHCQYDRINFISGGQISVSSFTTQ